MKKKIIIISSIVIALIALLITILLINNKKQITEEELLNKAVINIKNLIKYTNNNNFKTIGILNVIAKYKGAHGEHYPKEFIYNFNTRIEDNTYIVTIGNSSGYYEKEYKVPGLVLMNNIKNIDETTIDKIFKNKINIEELNKTLKTDYKKCKYEIDEYLNIKCDNDYITFEEDTIKLKYKENIFRIDTNEKMFSVTINDTLKMNAIYYDEMTRYNVVLNNNVIYFETSNNKLYLNSTSEAAIYNAMEVTVDYKDVVVDKNIKVEEIEIPIFRYFNELNLNYWRDSSE